MHNIIPSNDSFYKPKNIDCSHCRVGQFCCTLKVKLSFLDRARIFIYHGLRTRTYADRLFDGSGWGIRLIKGNCFFLQREPDGKAFCTIYNARPKICRQFPHFFEDIKDCRDIVKVWKRKGVDEVESTEVESNG